MKIVRTRRYLRDLKRLNATVAEVDDLERAIAIDPLAGDVIPGLGGIRKIRFSMGGRGKRGGGRAIYFLMMADDTAIMLFAYDKSSRTDLTADEKKVALALVKELKDDRG